MNEELSLLWYSPKSWNRWRIVCRYFSPCRVIFACGAWCARSGIAYKDNIHSNQCGIYFKVKDVNAILAVENFMYATSHLCKQQCETPWRISLDHLLANKEKFQHAFSRLWINDGWLGHWRTNVELKDIVLPDSLKRDCRRWSWTWKRAVIIASEGEVGSVENGKSDTHCINHRRASPAHALPASMIFLPALITQTLDVSDWSFLRRWKGLMKNEKWMISS